MIYVCFASLLDGPAIVCIQIWHNLINIWAEEERIESLVSKWLIRGGIILCKF